MSILYLQPKFVHHYLHNFMARRILEGDKFIGYFWIREQKVYSEFTFGSTRLLIWSKAIAIFKIILQTTELFGTILQLNEHKNIYLFTILNDITLITSNVIYVTSYITVMLRRKYIVKLFNLGMHFLFDRVG